MKSIGLFFDKFKSGALKEIKKREAICEAVYVITKARIEEKDISIKNCIVTIAGNQALKSELFLKKTAIIELISRRISDKIIDIK